MDYTQFADQLPGQCTTAESTRTTTSSYVYSNSSSSPSNFVSDPISSNSPFLPNAIIPNGPNDDTSAWLINTVGSILGTINAVPVDIRAATFFHSSKLFPSESISKSRYLVNPFTSASTDPAQCDRLVESFLGKKYKPVAKRTKPIKGTLPEEFRIVRLIHHLSNPVDSTHKNDTKKHDANPDGFLWPEEEKLVHHLISLQQDAFA